MVKTPRACTGNFGAAGFFVIADEKGLQPLCGNR
jgi:hypothetical protein